jgi:hypothetical protein
MDGYVTFYLTLKEECRLGVYGKQDLEANNWAEEGWQMGERGMEKASE